MQVLNEMGANGMGSFPFSGTTSNFAASQPVVAGQALHYGIISNHNDFDIFNKYLQTLGQTKVLSNPKIVVVNNQEAKIHVGERQAYVTTTTTSGQSTSTVAEEVTFVDVGIQLSVTANINDDGYITMKVKPEISSVVDTLTTPTGNKIPIIDTSLTETTVMMKNGTTLVIGGLRKEEKTLSSQGVPGLSKIPFVGFIFKSETSETEMTETLVMMTPYIISGDKLTRGNDRFFEDKPGKEYRDYQSMVPDKEIGAPEVPQEVEPKPYRDYSIPGDDDGGFRIKEMRYEPYVR
jgi:general secretion pathway protein D